MIRKKWIVRRTIQRLAEADGPSWLYSTTWVYKKHQQTPPTHFSATTTTNPEKERHNWRHIKSIIRSSRPPPIPRRPISRSPQMFVQTTIQTWPCCPRERASWPPYKNKPFSNTKLHLQSRPFSATNGHKQPPILRASHLGHKPATLPANNSRPPPTATSATSYESPPPPPPNAVNPFHERKKS